MKKIILSSIITMIAYTNLQAAEIKFKPASEFASPGMIGTYYEDLQQATIQNPASSDDNFYQFINVVTGGIATPSGLIKIGSYTYSPPARNGIKRMGMRMINVYGNLFNQDAMPGSNSRTYAPIVFAPSDEFSIPGALGNYFVGSQIATIHNPSLSDNQNDTLFTNIISSNNHDNPEGFEFIGSYTDQATQTATYLYGQKQMN